MSRNQYFQTINFQQISNLNDELEVFRQPKIIFYDLFWSILTLTNIFRHFDLSCSKYCLQKWSTLFDGKINVKNYLQALFKQGFILRNCTESSHSPRIYGPEFSCDNFLFVDINPPNSFKNSQKFVGIFAFMYSWNNSEKRCVIHQNKLWRIFCSLLRYRATCIFLMTNVRFRGWEFFSLILSSVFYLSNQFD